MSVALPSSSEVESNKDDYDAEFDGDATVARRDGSDDPDSSGLCVDRETSCIYTY
ncbi:hypothetical protein [Halorussus lipolyticus]|uniref:hypothetical protein n=1 Tax=Halorussus lipolyticus TaxID=3034024 RepID=UPI0023E7A550|nr:hypothetical protein [Halorussus sp. DT80]